MATNSTIRIAGQDFPEDFDPVAATLNAVGSVLSPTGTRWLARQVDLFDPTLPSSVTDYAWEKHVEPENEPAAGPIEITPRVTARVLEILNTHLTIPGERWYSDHPDGGADTDGLDLETGDKTGFPPGTVARILIFRMTDETARDYNLLADDERE